jgi:hypothetical protein
VILKHYLSEKNHEQVKGLPVSPLTSNLMLSREMKNQNCHSSFFSFHLYIIVSSHNFHTFRDYVFVFLHLSDTRKSSPMGSAFCTHNVN